MNPLSLYHLQTEMIGGIPVRPCSICREIPIPVLIKKGNRRKYCATCSPSIKRVNKKMGTPPAQRRPHMATYRLRGYKQTVEEKSAYSKEYHRLNKDRRKAHIKGAGKAAVDRTYLKQRCKKAGTTIENYASLPKRCSFTNCKVSSSGSGRDWALDHDHLTGKFRGLLCSSHNSMLGYAHDSIEELRDAIKYLTLHGKVEA